MNLFIILISAFLILLSTTFCNHEDLAFFILGLGFGSIGIITGLAGIIFDKNFFEC